MKFLVSVLLFVSMFVFASCDPYAKPVGSREDRIKELSRWYEVADGVVKDFSYVTKDSGAGHTMHTLQVDFEEGQTLILIKYNAFDSFKITKGKRNAIVYRKSLKNSEDPIVEIITFP